MGSSGISELELTSNGLFRFRQSIYHVFDGWDVLLRGTLTYSVTVTLGSHIEEDLADQSWYYGIVSEPGSSAAEILQGGGLHLGGPRL
ncbi:hypothetical protein N7478_004313 [Penicillium angulare]|uniref:uncharacterized protein n=1 Tax=Penicillium angulare TaxID=116970 RepID=UPI0025420E39|nr:uncharacterized protein N7478_004313 [Penicillium angulare]KAJ5278941.1 hypothetical protein N7478_004313 [Penicillium angulare]